MSFFTAGSWEKDTKNGAPRNYFGPSYFETALVIILIDGIFVCLYCNVKEFL